MILQDIMEDLGAPPRGAPTGQTVLERQARRCRDDAEYFTRSVAEIEAALPLLLARMKADRQSAEQSSRLADTFDQMARGFAQPNGAAS